MKYWNTTMTDKEGLDLITGWAQEGATLTVVKGDGRFLVFSSKMGKTHTFATAFSQGELLNMIDELREWVVKQGEGKSFKSK